MSKSKPKQQAPSSLTGTSEAIPPAKPVRKEKLQDVPHYRQCPLCFRGQGGVGVAYCTQGNRRYYKCNGCGHTWTAIVRVQVVKVEHREVELDGR